MKTREAGKKKFFRSVDFFFYQNFPGYREHLRILWEEHIRGKLFLARSSDRDFNSKNEKRDILPPFYIITSLR